MSSRIKYIIYPPHFNLRDIKSLKPFRCWSEDDISMHMVHNRILQKGFLNRDTHEFLQDAKLFEIDWLTDIACPSPGAALTLNIAKELIIHFKVPEDQLNEVTQRLFDELKEHIGAIEKELNKYISSDEFKAEMKSKTEEFDRYFKPKDREVQLSELTDAKNRIIKDMILKSKTNMLAIKVIKDYLDKNGVPPYGKKTLHDYSKNHDYI